MLGIRVNEGCKRWLVTWVTAGLIPASLACLALLAVPAGSYAAPALYVSQWAGGSGQSTVTVIDTETDTVVGTLPAGVGPSRLASSPDGSKLYGLNVPFPQIGSFAVSVIKTDRRSRAGIALKRFQPGALALTPDGRKLYVGGFEWLGDSVINEYIQVIDAVKRAKTLVIDVSEDARGMALTPDGAKLYVGSFGSSTMHVIDTVTDTATPIAVGAVTFGVTVNPAGTKVYVSVGGPDPHVAVIDTLTDSVIGVIDHFRTSRSVSVLSDNSKGYITGAFVESYVFDPVTDTLGDTLPIEIVSPIVFLPDGSKGYAIIERFAALGVFDPVSDTITKTIPISGELDSLALGPRGGISKGRFEATRQRYKLEGRFTPDAGGSIDPPAETVRFVVSSNSGTIVDATVPAGEFQVSASGLRYKFRRRRDELSLGLDRMKLRLPRKAYDSYIRFQAKGRDIDLSAVGAGDITIHLEIGDDVFDMTMPFVTEGDRIVYP